MSQPGEIGQLHPLKWIQRTEAIKQRGCIESVLP
jgi:hypothetical protein